MFFEECIEKLGYKGVHLHDGKTSDYSFNQVNALSKITGENPEDILLKIVSELGNIDNINCEIKGKSILINMKDEYLSEKSNLLLNNILNGNGNSKPNTPKKKIIIDYSSPNTAKEMHVGHLRSTIIGESLARLFEYLDNDVLRINHIGDWGTQFGMLIAYLKKNGDAHNFAYDIKEITQIYKQAKKLFDSDEEFKNTSRLETANLQNGNNTDIWKKLCDVSMEEFNKIYDVLGTHFTYIRGESFYQKYMEEMVEELPLVDYDGSKVIYSGDKYLMLVKSDGAFTYDTSDLAALKYRVEKDEADEIIYVVDLGQELHFQSLFAVANELNYSKGKKLEYVGFGAVLGHDGKKFKTRSGETVKLTDLLQSAYESAVKITKELSKGKWSDDKISQVAKKISINCIKYADLSNHRKSAYKFSLEKMLNTKGNTAVYLMYAMARCKSILRKVDFNTLQNYHIQIENKESRDLIFMLLKFNDVIIKTSEELMPNYLCNYLYDLVVCLTKFYENNRCIEFGKNNEIILIRENRICLIYLSVVLINKLFELIGLEQIDEL